MREQSAESGFTLVEVLVTVLILGLLAAVVFPVVVPQVDKADPTKASNDMANIRTGIEMFQLDVRPTEPGDIEDLVNGIVAGTDGPVEGGTFNSGQADRWEGPYVDITIPEIGTASSQTEPVAVTTGFDAPLLNDLFLYNNASASSPADHTASEASESNADFVAIRILDLTNQEFTDLNDQIDGEDETGPLTSGKLRCDSCDGTDPATTTDLDADGNNDDSITYFLAIPF